LEAREIPVWRKRRIVTVTVIVRRVQMERDSRVD
jgi:hypothetical protein